MDATRTKKLMDATAAAGLDALFITNPKNVQYIAGFHSTMPGEVQSFGDPEGFVLAYKGEIHLLCDGRYIAGAQELPGIKPRKIDSPTTAKIIADAIRAIIGTGKKTIGFESDALLYNDALGLMENLSDMEVKPAQQVPLGLRLIKTKEEVDLIRKAQDITGDCFTHITGWIKPGLSERDVAFEIDSFLRKNSEGNSFAPIVAFGETGARPHYTPDPKRKLEKGQMVLLDFGSVYHGYCGDMTRMLVMGKANDRHREVYDLVLQAQLNCLKHIKPGATCHDLDACCRDYFKDKGCADAFMHGTGHGVGLAIHEDPRIKPTFQNKVLPGMVFTVEPGLYYPGWGGVRIEDMVAITETGFENLTKTPKTLIEI